MKGLDAIPNTEALRNAYDAIRSGREVSPLELALWTQWARFDPRLAEQWVHVVAAQWRRIAPSALNLELHAQPWGSAAGPLTEEALELLPTAERKLFRAWVLLVTEGLQRGTDQNLSANQATKLATSGTHAAFPQFFIGLRAFAGKAMRQDAEASHGAYLKWGYLGREILRRRSPAAQAERAATRVSARQRQRLLGELLRQRDRVTVREYVKFLAESGASVGLRQAQLDLQRAPELVPRGQTRRRHYIRRPPAN